MVLASYQCGYVTQCLVSRVPGNNIVWSSWLPRPCIRLFRAIITCVSVWGLTYQGYQLKHLIFVPLFYSCNLHPVIIPPDHITLFTALIKVAQKNLLFFKFCVLYISATMHHKLVWGNVQKKQITKGSPMEEKQEWDKTRGPMGWTQRP